MIHRIGTAFVLALLLIPTVPTSDGYAQDEGFFFSPQKLQAPSSSENELMLMRRRMDQYEREMQWMRRQLEQAVSESPGRQFTGLGERKDGVAADSNANCNSAGAEKIEVIEIQTKPNHKMRGRLFFDQVMYTDAPGLGLDRENETGFDTARFGMYGNIYENVKYQIEIEFEGTEVDFKSVYIEATHLPYLGAFRAGHYYEPIAGLEEDSGSRYQMFMERSLAITAFVPSRSFGYMVHDTTADEDVYWAIGAFRHESDDSPEKRGSIIGDSGDWVVTGRLAWNPYYDEPSDGRYLIHLGLGYSFRPDASVVEFDTRSELGNQGGFLATTVPGDQDYSLFVPEFLAIWGPWSVQSEFAYIFTGSADFWSGYIEASYFLTGGHRGYNRSRKTLTRPMVVEDFFSVRSPLGLVCGAGGWEIKTRWSHVNMRDGVGPMRGSQNNLSAGFNWYLNSYTRIMFDYVYEDVSLVSGAAGVAHNFGTRFQVHW